MIRKIIEWLKKLFGIKPQEVICMGAFDDCKTCPTYPDFDENQYYRNYLDLAKAKQSNSEFSALEHWCKNGRNEGRSYKLIDRYGKEYVTPAEWDAVQYAKNYNQIAQWGSNWPVEGMGEVNVLDHYAKYGQYEGKTYKAPDITDWEDEAYLYHFKDKKPPIAESEYANNPLQHYYDWGFAAGWKFKPDGWKSSEYLRLNKDIANHEYYKDHPLEHWWKNGEKEGRKYKEVPDPTPPGPTPSGLSLIFEDATDPNECFSYMEHEGHAYIGRYGLYTGGAKILKDGKVMQQLSNPLTESVFKMMDGLASTENYASMYRLESDRWVKKYQRPEEESLGLDFERLSNGAYIFLWNVWAGLRSGLARSDDNGKTWYDWKFYQNLLLAGLAVDENDQITLCGRNSTGQIIVDVNGRTIFHYPKYNEGYMYWPIISRNGKINVGTWNSIGKGDHRFGYIDLIENGNRKQALIGVDYPYMHSMAILKGVRYCIATWDWNEEGKESMLFSSIDGLNWAPVCRVPCSSILNIFPINDSWLALCGGTYRKIGKVFAYKP